MSSHGLNVLNWRGCGGTASRRISREGRLPSVKGLGEFGRARGALARPVNFGPLLAAYGLRRNAATLGRSVDADRMAFVWPFPQSRLSHPLHLHHKRKPLKCQDRKAPHLSEYRTSHYARLKISFTHSLPGGILCRAIVISCDDGCPGMIGSQTAYRRDRVSFRGLGSQLEAGSPDFFTQKLPNE